MNRNKDNSEPCLAGNDDTGTSYKPGRDLGRGKAYGHGRGFSHRKGHGPGHGHGKGRHSRGCARGETRDLPRDGCCLLSDLLPGESAVVADLIGGRNCRNKLLSLGVIPGAPIDIVRGDRRSGICLRIGRSIFMLNFHLANQIAVKKVS